MSLVLDQRILSRRRKAPKLNFSAPLSVKTLKYNYLVFYLRFQTASAFIFIRANLISRYATSRNWVSFDLILRLFLEEFFKKLYVI